jgi:hypothetical protein
LRLSGFVDDCQDLPFNFLGKGCHSVQTCGCEERRRPDRRDRAALVFTENGDAARQNCRYPHLRVQSLGCGLRITDIVNPAFRTKLNAFRFEGLLKIVDMKNSELVFGSPQGSPKAGQ